MHNSRKLTKESTTKRTNDATLLSRLCSQSKTATLTVTWTISMIRMDATATTSHSQNVDKFWKQSTKAQREISIAIHTATYRSTSCTLRRVNLAELTSSEESSLRFFRCGLILLTHVQGETH